MDMDLQFGKRLRRRRLVLGLTQQQVGAMIGVRFQQIHKYETAANCMNAARLWQLACVLEVPVSYFYDGLPDFQLDPLRSERPAALSLG